MGRFVMTVTSRIAFLVLATFALVWGIWGLLIAHGITPKGYVVIATVLCGLYLALVTWVALS